MCVYIYIYIYLTDILILSYSMLNLQENKWLNVKPESTEAKIKFRNLWKDLIFVEWVEFWTHWDPELFNQDSDVELHLLGHKNRDGDPHKNSPEFIYVYIYIYIYIH